METMHMGSFAKLDLCFLCPPENINKTGVGFKRTLYISYRYLPYEFLSRPIIWR